MKLKSKMIASIMSVCLVCAVFVIGVFALKTANLKIGGDVSFSATGVEADIKNATLTGATTNDQVLATGAINTSMTQADIDTTFENWQSLELDFNENGDNIVLSFQIANTSTNANNYIEIDYSFSFSNENANISVEPGVKTGGVYQNNSYLLKPKAAAAEATYSTFTLNFKVTNKELNVPDNTKLNLNLTLNHTTPAVLQDGVYNGVRYTLSDAAPYTATVSGKTGTVKDIVIPAVVTDGTNHYVVETIGNNAFGYWGEMTSLSLPSTVKTFGREAFYGCYLLTSFDFPKALESMGEKSMASFGGIELLIPGGVRQINKGVIDSVSAIAFEDQVGWTSSVLLDDVNPPSQIAIDVTDPVLNAQRNNILANYFGFTKN